MPFRISSSDPQIAGNLKLPVGQPVDGKVLAHNERTPFSKPIPDDNLRVAMGLEDPRQVTKGLADVVVGRGNHGKIS